MYAINVECITVLQKRVVRLVCGARCLDHTNPLFKQLGILKFVDLVKFKTVTVRLSQVPLLSPSHTHSCKGLCKVKQNSKKKLE